MNEFFNRLFTEFRLPLANPVLVFSLILLIILFAPIMLRKFNIPGIIGLILSGVIIGPYGFNILARNSAVELFSTIGLLYIMFIAGVELDINDFKVNRNKSLLFGFLTFGIPISIGFPVCYHLLGYDLNASILTASMYATQTLIAYPIVSKLGVSKNQAVAITVGGTILTDTAVLILLSIIMGNHRGNLNEGFWIRLGVSLAIISVIMFVLIPKIAKWFFQKLESENQAQYIFVLFVVFLAAFLTETAGLEPIIGAFIAGLTLNRFIPHSSTLMNRIEFIGNALFIPFFLISVGMLVDVRVIFNGPAALVIAATLIIVALTGKWLAAFLTQMIFKYSVAQRQLIFGLSSAHAAATLAVILVGFKAHIIDENILNGTIILILVTSIVATFATEKAAREILLSDEYVHAGASELNLVTEEHILVPVANQSNLNKLLDFSLIIKDKKSSNPITMLSVVQNNQEAEINIIRSRKKLEEFVKQGAASEIRVNPITTIDQNPADGIARISREIMADIIIIGWPDKPGFFDKLFGEKVDSIIHLVDKNLLICYFDKPLISHKKIALITHAMSERERGFETWLQKAIRISRELTIPVVHYGDEKTYQAIQSNMKQLKNYNPFSHKLLAHGDDMDDLSNEISQDDLIICISARKNSLSYQSRLDKIPSRLERQFEKNNKILVYPQQTIDESYHVIY